MGLFDKVLGAQQEVTLTPVDAFTGVLLATVAADGHVSSEESEELVAVSNRLPIYRNQSAAEFNRMMEKLIGLLNRAGPSGLLQQSAAVLPDRLRESAFAVATDLVFADGEVAAEERQLLERLQSALHVSEAAAVKIVEVIALKNQA